MSASPGVLLPEGAWQETPDYTHFKEAVRRKSGIDLSLYKPQQMIRRLQAMLDRTGASNFEAYFQIMERDPNEYAAFLDRMTINVSELFRNPEKWQEMRERILPELLRGGHSLKVWSAGCSYGAEPYTLAILLDQLAPAQKHTLHATDLDRLILSKAKEGRFTNDDMKNVEPALRERYFVGQTTPSSPYAITTPMYQAKPELRSRVQFRPHNLLADPFESGYDLICCRNVVIYFTDEAKERLFARFAEALAPGGFLFVGGTERIFNSRALGLEMPLPFFYQRVR